MAPQLGSQNENRIFVNDAFQNIFLTEHFENMFILSNHFLKINLEKHANSNFDYPHNMSEL